MALKHLELSEMAGLTASWVGAQRPLLEAIPQAVAWLPALDEVHQRVVKAQPASTSELDQELGAIAAQELVVDLRHDDLVRFTSWMLQAEQCRCRAAEQPEVERAALCERALAALLPNGLLIVNALYVAEAGNAVRTRQLLASEGWLRELLGSIPTAGKGTLLASVETCCALGERLRQLEEQKAAVQGRIAGTPQPPRAEMFAARNEWLKVVGLLLSNFEMIKDHQREIETLRAPVLRTADVAGKRGGSSPHASVDGSGALDASSTAASSASSTDSTNSASGGSAAPVAVGMPGARPFD
jgi:hypothetical protein